MSTRRFRLASLTLAVALGLLAWTTLPNLAEEKPTAAQAVSGNVTITVETVGEGEPAKDVQTAETRKLLERNRHEIERQIEATNTKIAEIKSRLSSSENEESDDAGRERKLITSKLEELQRERARLIEQRRFVGITIGPVTTTMRIALKDNPAAQQRIKLVEGRLALLPKHTDDEKSAYALRVKRASLQQELDHLIESQDQELLAQIAHGLGLKAKMQPVPARGFPILNGQRYLGRADVLARPSAIPVACTETEGDRAPVSSIEVTLADGGRTKLSTRGDRKTSELIKSLNLKLANLSEIAKELDRAGQKDHANKLREQAELLSNDIHAHYRAQLKELLTQFEQAYGGSPSSEPTMRMHGIPIAGKEGQRLFRAAHEMNDPRGPRPIQMVEAEVHPELQEHQEVLQKLSHRIRHLMQAAENLEQAGDHDLARGLRQKAEHLQAEAKEHQVKLEARMKEARYREGEKMARLRSDSHNEPITQLKEIVGDLRNEVRELRSEIRALREDLKDDDDSDEKKSERKSDTRREEKRDGDRDDRDKDRDEAKNDHRSRSLIIPTGAIQVKRPNPVETKKSHRLGIEFKLTGTGQNGSIQFITVGEEESPHDDAVEAKKPVTDKLINSIDRPQLDYRIAAQVVDVMPNGNLAIESRRSYCENNELWEYVLTGIIRADDIRHENFVFNEDIANLDIIKRKR